ncbi:MAG: hypothetical protein H6825_13220 [Planctomycetes bacterium]|nr:hypothetical protein [Planctomycetota bacterium]
MNDTIDEPLLFSRALERRASRAEWDALERRAHDDPRVALRLLAHLRDEGELSLALDARLSALPDVELPAPSAPQRGARALRLPRVALLFGATGWAAACVLAALLVLRVTSDERAGATRPSRAAPVATSHDASRGVGERADGATHDADADARSVSDAPVGAVADALASDAPTVLHEFPRVLVETRETDDGRVEVTWLRRALETQTVDAAFEVVEDELGRPTVVPADLSMLAVSDIL